MTWVPNSKDRLRAKNNRFFYREREGKAIAIIIIIIIRNSAYTVKILLLAFFSEYMSHSFHVRQQAENHSEIRRIRLLFDFLRVVGICAIVFVERERDESMDNNDKRCHLFLSFWDMVRESFWDMVREEGEILENLEQ